MTLLEGLRVVEVSGTGAASLAAKHFADWGADVTILEPADGTPIRHAPPFYDVDGERRSATWAWLRMGKTAVRTGGGTPVSHEDAVDFCSRADVCLLETEMVRPVLGLDPGDIRETFEGKASVVLISPFGLDGPYGSYAATDLGLAALGGWTLGSPDREPIRPGGGSGGGIVWRVAGAWALVAALTSLHYTRNGGLPQYIDLSMQACAASSLTPQWLMAAGAAMAQARRGNTFPAGAMHCADGWVGVSPLTPTHHEMLFRILGLDDVLDEGGLDPAYRAEHADELGARVQPWFDERTRTEVFETAQGWRLPAAPFQSVDERLECPQLAARGFWVPAEVDGRQVKVPRVPYLIQGAEPVRRAPLAESETLPAADGPGTAGHGLASDPRTLPLEGLRILDLTWFWSGPSAMKLMGALGADVIKIESIQRPDSFRFTSANMSMEKWIETGPLWLETNTNKRGVTLDLAREEGKALFEQLVPLADVVISNFSNRVMPNLGLTNDRLLEMNPQLIAVTMPGYGPGGPWEDYVGYGVSFEQLCACASMTGYPDGMPIIMGGFSDPLVGVHTVASILLALKRREETGAGADIEIPQCETLDSTWAPEHIAVQMGAPVPGMVANRDPVMAPHNAYRVGEGDSWLTIAVATDAEFEALCHDLGAPALAEDDRFRTTSTRKTNEEALDAAIAGMVADEEIHDLERRLQAAGVRACHVVWGSDLDRDPGLLHFGFFKPMEREVTGTNNYRQFPFHCSSFRVEHRRAPPLLGEHTEEVLQELLGISDADLASLASQQVTGKAPVGAAATT